MPGFKTAVRMSAFGLALVAAPGWAMVPASDANQLGATLTPMGAERAGNADGSIPAWAPLSKNAGAVDAKGFLADPYSNEQPLFVIDAKNVSAYASKLAPGQVAMIKRYPDTYRLPVYPGHRGATVPDEVFAAIKANATQARLVADGNSVENFKTAVPFPIPRNGLEVIWNHITRYRGGAISRTINQVTPQQNGSYSLVTFKDSFVFRERMKGYDPNNPGNVLSYFKQEITAPAALAGTVLLVHETLDQVKEPRSAWVYNAGQRRVRKAPQVTYDSPGTAADGMRTADNQDMYNGAPDRYDWKLVGKQEMYIPANSYRLDAPTLKYADIIKPGHINQDLTRYELRRVWHVVATLKPGARHIYARRDFYFDEDTWQAAEADHYDVDGQLWRVAEAHAVNYYNYQVPWTTLETLYDLHNGRYLALGMKNEEKRAYNFEYTANPADYSPAALRQEGIR